MVQCGGVGVGCIPVTGVKLLPEPDTRYCKLQDVTAAPPVFEGVSHTTDIELTPDVVVIDAYGGGSGVVAGMAFAVVEKGPEGGPPLLQYVFTAAT